MVAARLTPRRLRVIATLALALAMGSAGQPSPAQAAPASAKEYVYTVLATLDRGNATICVGDNVIISVTVVRQQIEENLKLTNRQNTSGIRVEGSVQDPSIGNLIMAGKYTGWNSDQPGIAVFAFHAEKPGKTTLTFKAAIHYYRSTLKKWLYGPAEIAESNPVDVTVEECMYKVTTTSRWNAFGLNYVAMIDKAAMTADAPGRYTGTATVKWVITNDPPCPHAITPTSQADLTGSLDEDDQMLVVDLAYQPVKDTWYGYMSFDCTLTSWNMTMSYTPAGLTFSVPASGGGYEAPQALVDNSDPAAVYGNISGHTVVFVEPVTGQ